MLALVLEGERVRLATDRPPPKPRRGFVRVRTRIAGICDTDLELARGYMGFAGVLGHEFVGEALEGPLAGRRVVGGINFACGQCPNCAAGLGRHCPNRTVLGIDGADGVLAEEFVIPEGNLVAVPGTVADEEAVFTEPLAAACEILDQLGRRPDGAALVVGDGKLGTLIAQVLAAAGARVDLLGHHTESLDWLVERGIGLLPGQPDRAAYPLVVEASGSTSGLATAMAATAPRGTLVLKTTVGRSYDIDLAPLVIDEITLIGSRCGRFEPALELLTEGAVRVAPLVEACYRLTDAEQAFAHAGRPAARKVLVRGN